MVYINSTIAPIVVKKLIGKNKSTNIILVQKFCRLKNNSYLCTKVEFMSNLDKKVERAIRLLRAIPSDDIELAFSGGKDSSVILKLAQMAGIKFTPIYKNTTIDPSGNIQFCKSMGCTITPPP